MAGSTGFLGVNGDLLHQTLLPSFEQRLPVNLYPSFLRQYTLPFLEQAHCPILSFNYFISYKAYSNRKHKKFVCMSSGVDLDE